MTQQNPRPGSRGFFAMFSAGTENITTRVSIKITGWEKVYGQ